MGNPSIVGMVNNSGVCIFSPSRSSGRDLEITCNWTPFISYSAGELEMSYTSGDHRYGFIAMMARGDKEIQDPNKEGLNYLRDLSGYYEIMPGTYKGTQFYFNGGSTELNSGTGLGHSINNTSMLGLRYNYDVPDSETLYLGGIYQLKRMQDEIGRAHV